MKAKKESANPNVFKSIKNGFERYLDFSNEVYSTVLKDDPNFSCEFNSPINSFFIPNH